MIVRQVLCKITCLCLRKVHYNILLDSFASFAKQNCIVGYLWRTPISLKYIAKKSANGTISQNLNESTNKPNRVDGYQLVRDAIGSTFYYHPDKEIDIFVSLFSLYVS